MAAICLNNDSLHGMYSYVSSKGIILSRMSKRSKRQYRNLKKVMSLIGKTRSLFNATNLTNFKYKLSKCLPAEAKVYPQQLSNSV